MMKEDPKIFEDVSVNEYDLGASSLRCSTMLVSDVKCNLGRQIQSRTTFRNYHHILAEQ